MRKILSVSLMILSLQAFAVAAEVEKIETYIVDVPVTYFVPYQGRYKTVFPNGFEIGTGSALAFKQVNSDGSLEFYALSDRGPNADGPGYEINGQKYDGKIFPTPGFVPQIATLTLASEQVKITKILQLKDATGKPISGLPLPKGTLGSTGEVAFDENFELIALDPQGLDAEGLAVDKDGNFWVSDEYGPFVVKYDGNGKEIERLAPGSGLPEVLKYRIPNRGMEGLSLSPSGKTLFGAMQSVLDIEGKTAGTAMFTRIVAIDLATRETKTYAYPINKDYKSPKGAKIGDIYALSETQLLLIEQGKDREGKMQNRIYKVDLEGATDLEVVTAKEQEAEFSDTANGVTMATKELVVDLRQHGWDIEKAEGLTLLPNRKTIVLINDNDFNMRVDFEDSEHPKEKINSYTHDGQGQFFYQGMPVHPRFGIVPNSPKEAHMQLWLLTLKDKL